MSSFVIFGKIAAGAVASSAVIGTGFALSYGLFDTKTSSNKTETPVVPAIFAITSSVTSPSGVSDTSAVADYACQSIQTNQEKLIEDCKIELFVPSSENDKKLHKHSSLNNTNWKKATYAELGKENSLLKIEVAEKLFSELFSSTPSKTLKVVKKNDATVEIASLKPLFDNLGKTKASYAIAKVSGFLNESTTVDKGSSPITIQKEGNKCLFSKNDKSSNGLSCTIHKLSDASQDSLDSLAFTTDLTDKQESITKNHHYLFKLTTDSEHQLPIDFLSKTTVKVKLAQNVESGSIDALELSELMPAYIFSPSSPERLFAFEIPSDQK